MNLTEARRFAAERDYTHVSTNLGWQPITEWFPYGVRSDEHLGASIEFRDDPPRFEVGGSWLLARHA